MRQLTIVNGIKEHLVHIHCIHHLWGNFKTILFVQHFQPFSVCASSLLGTMLNLETIL